MGKLSIVATPIGNLGDITFRAVETLKSADIILAEDTRITGKLLKHFEISPKILLPFFEGNEDRKLQDALKLMTVGEKHVALVSDAGTPLVSDPGYKLVREAIAHDVEVESIPGPTALIVALTLSGLPTNAFLFLGFLPKKEAHVRRLFMQTKDALRDIDQLKTLVFYESPYRLIRSLHLIKQVFGEVDLAIARELTKLHEEIRRESIEEAIKHFTKTVPKGELVVILSVN